jgi:predicted dehydrogenase
MLQGALIGCGYVSQFHLAAWPTVPGARIIALCDADRRRLHRAARMMPDARVYVDAAELLNREPDLDFVEICTGPESHQPLVELAAGRGMHVLCQKPAAVSRPEFLAMMNACTTAGVRLMIHENWRFRPWYRALRAEIEAGTVGRPIRLRIAHHDARALRPDGPAQQPYLGEMRWLILMDVGCHLVDAARYLMGEVDSVSATVGRFGCWTVGEDVAMLALAFAGGTLGWLDTSWCTPAEGGRPEWALNPTAVEGTAGTLRVLPDGWLEWIGLDGRRERRPVSLPPDDRVYVDGYAAVQRHFIEGLLTGAAHETSAADNLKTMDVIWAAYRSAEEGRQIAVQVRHHGNEDPNARGRGVAAHVAAPVGGP